MPKARNNTLLTLRQWIWSRGRELGFSWNYVIAPIHQFTTTDLSAGVFNTVLEPAIIALGCIFHQSSSTPLGGGAKGCHQHWDIRNCHWEGHGSSGRGWRIQLGSKISSFIKLTINLYLLFTCYCVVHKETIPEERQFTVVNLFYYLQVKLGKEAGKIDFKVCGSERDSSLPCTLSN